MRQTKICGRRWWLLGIICIIAVLLVPGKSIAESAQQLYDAGYRAFQQNDWLQTAQYFFAFEYVAAEEINQNRNLANDVNAAKTYAEDVLNDAIYYYTNMEENAGFETREKKLEEDKPGISRQNLGSNTKTKSISADKKTKKYSKLKTQIKELKKENNRLRKELSRYTK